MSSLWPSFKTIFTFFFLVVVSNPAFASGRTYHAYNLVANADDYNVSVQLHCMINGMENSVSMPYDDRRSCNNATSATIKVYNRNARVIWSETVTNECNDSLHGLYISLSGTASRDGADYSVSSYCAY